MALAKGHSPAVEDDGLDLGALEVEQDDLLPKEPQAVPRWPA